MRPLGIKPEIVGAVPKLQEHLSDTRTVANERWANTGVGFPCWGQTEPYAEDTPLTWVFGDDAETWIVAALLSEPSASLTVYDVARLAGADKETTRQHLVQLQRHDLACCLESSDCEQAWTLNTDLAAVQQLRSAESSLLRNWYRKTRL